MILIVRAIPLTFLIINAFICLVLFILYSNGQWVNYTSRHKSETQATVPLFFKMVISVVLSYANKSMPSVKSCVHLGGGLKPIECSKPSLTLCNAAWAEGVTLYRMGNGTIKLTPFMGVVIFCPCLFCPSANFESCLALPTRWHTSVRALSYWYLFCDPRRWDNSRKVRAPRRVSASGAPHVVTWT